jgi:hypothetical protein
MFFDKIKRLLKNGTSSVVILENERPAYVIMDYAFFEKMALAESGARKNIEINMSDNVVQSLNLDELEEESVDDVLEEENVEFNLSDLPV